MIQISKDINVLIACEVSQAECAAFRELGFNAYSSDVQIVRASQRLDWHIPGDCTPLVKGRTHFMTQDGKYRRVDRWHLIIAHPPCTYLCKVSSVHMYDGAELDQERFKKMQEAKSFFMMCLDAAAPFVAVENPLPMAMAGLPPADCFIQPYWFGAPYSKKTLYWLKNLPPIMPMADMDKFKQYVHCSRGKYRSRTFAQVAQALAEQWGDYVMTQLAQEP